MSTEDGQIVKFNLSMIVEKEYYQALFYASFTFDKKLYVHVNKVVKLHKINLSDFGETS